MRIYKTSIRLIAAIMPGMIAAGCQAEPSKSLPELPLTVESIEAFANPKDVELLLSTSYYSGTSKNYVYQRSAIFEEFRPIYEKIGLVPWMYPGFIVKTREKYDSDQWISRHEIVPGIIDPAWSSRGQLVYDNFFEVSKDDIDLINQFEHMSVLDISGSTEWPLDVEWFSTDLPLKAFHLRAPSVRNSSALCRYPDLRFARYISSGIRGAFDTSRCSDQLETLFVVSSNVEALKIRGLPSLATLNLAGTEVEQLHIDGNSLPNLKSLMLENVDWPSDLSGVQLPEGLVQILMEKVKDNDLSQLQLPENLQYLRLALAELDDYSFITQAKHLKHLQLVDSNFDQWELLAELPELEHLGLSGTTLTDEDLSVLLGLKNLQTLNLGGTRITTAKPLEALQTLNFLNLYNSDIEDLNEIPVIEGISYLGLPTVEAYKSSSLPEEVRATLEHVHLQGFQCNGLKPCSLPAWE